ncbi:MAG: hypothetical protein QM758_29075 [Armatimonas sp.]
MLMSLPTPFSRINGPARVEFGDISDGIHSNIKDGKTFDSSSNILSYSPTSKGTPGSVEVISVKIFKGPINKRVAIGTAVSTITYLGVKINPASAKLNAGETATFQVEVQGIAPTVIPQLKYQWLTTRNAGELAGSSDGGVNIPVETPTATYKADAVKEGTDILTVSIQVPGKTDPVTAKASVQVGEGSLFPIAIGYSATHEGVYTDPQTGKVTTLTLGNTCSGTGTFNGVSGLLKWETTQGLGSITQSHVEYYGVTGNLVTSYGSETTYTAGNGGTTDVHTPPLPSRYGDDACQ